MSEPILSLCIPTNGIIEWIIPVLDSIYDQNVDESLFEVVIADNGNNPEFADVIADYAAKKMNLEYKHTTAQGFLNQTESYKIAHGSFIKFINHRMQLLPGTIQTLIDFAKENIDIKPVVYFSNGQLKSIKKVTELCDSFDMFVSKLSYWSSWSSGIALWKEDLDLLDTLKYNSLFPHTDLLFSRRYSTKYIIDNRVLLREIPSNWALKGKYDLFNTFAVEYIALILDLYRDGSISKKTFLKVKRENFTYISDRYIIYVFLGKQNSFDLSNYIESINVFYDIWKIRMSVIRLPALLLRVLLQKIQSRQLLRRLNTGAQ